jgi:hypothetical protein
MDLLETSPLGGAQFVLALGFAEDVAWLPAMYSTPFWRGLAWFGVFFGS